jgi:hypothetical protein
LFQSSLSKTPPLSDSRKDFPRHSNRRAASNQNANCQPCLCPYVLPMSMPRAHPDPLPAGRGEGVRQDGRGECSRRSYFVFQQKTPPD